jgi:hypothetical protein
MPAFPEKWRGYVLFELSDGQLLPFILYVHRIEFVFPDEDDMVVLLRVMLPRRVNRPNWVPTCVESGAKTGSKRL